LFLPSSFYFELFDVVIFRMQPVSLALPTPLLLGIGGGVLGDLAERKEVIAFCIIAPAFFLLSFSLPYRAIF
jgi:hypothetical protein